MGGAEMSEWKKINFLDFIVLQRGFDLTRDSIKEGPYPVVCSTSIMGYHNKYKVEGPGVVTGRSGTLGETQYVKENFWPHNTTLFVKDYKGNNRKFVYYYLRNFDFASMGGGAAIPSLNRNVLSNLSITIPNLFIQNEIATLLSRYDSLIENYQKQIKLLEEAAQRLYKEWFIDLHFPGHETTKIVDGVPEGWGKKRLIDIAKLKAGGDKPEVFSKDKTCELNVPVFSNGTINDGLYGYTDNAEINDQCVTISARGSVGYTVLRRKPFVPIVRLISVIPSNVYVGYLYYYIKGMSKESNGAAQQQITVPMIKNKEVIIPRDQILDSFEEMVEPYLKVIENYKELITSLSEARDRMLPKLMSGEINVE